MEGQRIELKRKDFSLIVTTVSGEQSVRNLFVPILSRYIREAKQDEEIDSCFRKMNNELHAETSPRADSKTRPHATQTGSLGKCV